jgi:hypothetical protein
MEETIIDPLFGHIFIETHVFIEIIKKRDIHSG